MSTSDLELRQVCKSYATPAGALAILHDVNLTMSRGEALAVTGPSGSGKSTLLHIAGTLETPTAGTVTILGQNPFALGRSELARFRNTSIGLIFQDHYLLPQCSVLENVLLPTLAGQGAGAAQERRAQDLLDQVGLTARSAHRPAELSGGERQRVAICRALINQPPVLLADEPTGNLDHNTAHAVGTLLLELAARHNALLIAVTHSLELAARFPKRARLVDGRLKNEDGG
ncbi:MAG: ABC transporter ATP-binding protein [Planctomycetaceae bacterium]